MLNKYSVLEGQQNKLLCTKESSATVVTSIQNGFTAQTVATLLNDLSTRVIPSMWQSGTTSPGKVSFVRKAVLKHFDLGLSGNQSATPLSVEGKAESLGFASQDLPEPVKRAIRAELGRLYDRTETIPVTARFYDEYCTAEDTVINAWLEEASNEDITALLKQPVGKYWSVWDFMSQVDPALGEELGQSLDDGFDIYLELSHPQALVAWIQRERPQISL